MFFAETDMRLKAQVSYRRNFVPVGLAVFVKLPLRDHSLNLHNFTHLCHNHRNLPRCTKKSPLQVTIFRQDEQFMIILAISVHLSGSAKLRKTPFIFVCRDDPRSRI